MAIEFCNSSSDISEGRLKKAMEMGADGVINVTGKDPKILAAQVHVLLDREPDVTIECSGAEESTQLGICVSSLFKTHGLAKFHCPGKQFSFRPRNLGEF